MLYYGFPAVFDNNSRVLILGSFPSIISRDSKFYYGNRNNRFWQVMNECLDNNIGKSVEDKIKFLLSHNIALWDIVSSCEIEGSLDSGIRNYTISDLDIILSHALIKKILCNGRTAHKLTVRYYGNIGLPIIYLPSTSPANVRFDIKEWKRELR